MKNSEIKSPFFSKIKKLDKTLILATIFSDIINFKMQKIF